MTLSNIAAAEGGNYGEIGKLLFAARKDVRVSIDEASRLLHIRVRYLEALEGGRLHELPGLTYTRGYLQSYATFLGLDKDEILRRFDETEGLAGRKNFYFPQVFSRDKTPSPWIIWGSLGFAVVVYAFWVFLLHTDPAQLSQVGKMPVPKSQAHISISNLRDVTCLQRQDVLYPPCIVAKAPDFTMLPVSREHVSVMELGQ